MKNIVNKKLQQGFTIIEMIVYMGVVSVFLAVISTMFSSIVEGQLETEATSEVEQDRRYIYSRLVYDIGRATAISTPASLGTAGNTLAIVVGGVTYTYSVSGGVLQLTDGGGTEALSSARTSVSNFSITRLGNNPGKQNVKITMTVTSETQRASGAESRSINTTIGLR